jgi:hypothetical protein
MECCRQNRHVIFFGPRDLTRIEIHEAEKSGLTGGAPFLQQRRRSSRDAVHMATSPLVKEGPRAWRWWPAGGGPRRGVRSPARSCDGGSSIFFAARRLTDSETIEIRFSPGADSFRDDDSPRDRGI